MTQDVKVWEINERGSLKEISKSKLDLEKRLEEWLEKDISMISNDLLVIGRQVETEFGGTIDLLCIEYNGDVLVVELKRDKTPREITAQVLDYASWIKDLSNEKITEIANKYLGDKGPIEEAFKGKFGMEIPEILNEHHKMLVVASKIDSSSERIIKYLSDSYGVGINAITFQYFKNEEGKEFFARVFLIDPEEAEYRTQRKSDSKRKPRLTCEELQEIAEKNGVGEKYKRIVGELLKYFDQSVTTRSSIAFIGILGEKKSANRIFSILPKESDSEKGVRFVVYIDRFADYFHIEKEDARDILPSYEEKAEYEEWAGEFGGGFFRDEKQIEKFSADLNEFKQR
jgi:hypothetical protein